MIFHYWAICGFENLMCLMLRDYEKKRLVWTQSLLTLCYVIMLIPSDFISIAIVRRALSICYTVSSQTVLGWL